jgi:hypothetical protein
MSSEMHTTEIEADKAAVEPTGALKTASDFKHTIDGHVIAAVAGACGESPHVNGRSSRLNTTIIPFPDRRAAFAIPRLPMVRPAKDLPGSVFTPALSIYQPQPGLRFSFCSSNSLERR